MTIVAPLADITVARAEMGVGAKPIPGAEVILDGTREMLDEKWTYWDGPRFSSSLPIKWKVVEDPVGPGTAIKTNDPAAAGGKFGAADIVTKKAYKDFRELLARKDIDAVCICTPDHWHSIPAIAAANAGKDIFCEKPLSHTLAEGIAMVDAVQKNKRIWQTGSWQRSVASFRWAVELVQNGYIGKVSRVEVGLPSGHADFGGTGNNKPNGMKEKST